MNDVFYQVNRTSSNPQLPALGSIRGYSISLLQKSLSFILIIMLTLPPSAFAGGIVPDSSAPSSKRPSMDAAANGVPVVNIAAPSNSGLSHNQYSDFNVSERGAILNNAAKAGVSQLGGGVMGNPNIAKSRPAKAILNEVTSSNRSHIQGYIEVFGSKADVILANPNGITINGGGFINTGSAMVTTGKPFVDGAGHLKHFDVTQGSIRIEGQGINASNLTGFDVVARAAEINAQVHANNLNIVAGANRYDPSTGHITPLEQHGEAAPSIAIDSSALGGMYAGRIALTSTDKGVGINLQGLAQSQSDLSITADGQIIARAASAQQNITIDSRADTVNVAQALQAGNSISLTGQHIAVNDATVVANTSMSMKAAGEAQLTKSTLGAQNVTLEANTVGLDNSRVSSLQDVSIKGKNVSSDKTVVAANNRLAIIGSEKAQLTESTLRAKAFDLTADNLTAVGSTINSSQDVSINARSMELSGGGITAGNNVSLGSSSTQNFTSDKTTTIAGNDITVRAKNITLLGETPDSSHLHVNTTKGSLYAQGSLTLTAQENMELEGGILGGQKELHLAGNNISLQNGALYSGGKSQVVSEKLLSLEGITQISEGRTLLSGDNVALSGGSTWIGDNLSVQATQQVFLSNGAVFLTEKAFSIVSKVLSFNDAAIAAKEKAVVKGESVSVAGGSIRSDGNLDMQALQEGSVTKGATLFSGKNLSLSGKVIRLGEASRATDALPEASVVSAQSSTTPKNREVTLVSLGDMAFNAPKLRMTGSDVKTAGNVTVTAEDSLRMSDSASLSAEGNVSITGGSLRLQKSSISSNSQLGVVMQRNITIDEESSLLGFSRLLGSAANIKNMGLVYSGGELLLQIKRKLENLNGGTILSSGDIILEGSQAGARMQTLHNQASTIESMDGSLTIAADKLLNDGGAAETRKVFVGNSYIGLGTSIHGFNPDGSRNHLGRRKQLHSKVRGAVREHLRKMEEEHGIPAHLPNKGDGLQEWVYEYKDEIIKAPTPAFILAAKDIGINAGSVENRLSHINAGRDITIRANALHNEGVELSSYHEVYRRFLEVGWKKGKRGKRGKSILKRKTNTYFSGKKVVDALVSSIAATGQLIIETTESFNNSSVKAGEAYLGKASGTPAFNDLEITGNLDLSNSGKALLHSDASMPRVSMPDTSMASAPVLMADLHIIPPTGLFTLNANPTHSYLIETNKKLTNLGYFYGSDYFFTRLGFKHKNEHHARLLGDAFYETRMIREQLMAQTGKRYLYADITSDTETMRQLMDNAAEAGVSMGLSVGVALHADQVTGLTKDIVWLEEQTYMGHRVLVPRLYLCEGTRAALATRGSVISGDTVQVASKEFANSGMISGNTVQIASIADMVNAGGDIFGKTSLLVRSDGSIINRSGSIGGGDITLSAQRILAETFTTDRVQGGNSQTIMHQVADITGTGTVRLLTPGDIALKGARVKGDTAALLVAGNNITMDSVAAHITHKAKRLHASQTGQLGSSVTGGDVLLQAGHDVKLVGSHITASNDTELSAGHNIHMEAARGESHYYNKTVTKGGTFGGSSSSVEQHDRVVNLGSSIAAGGNMAIKAGQDVAQGLGHIVMKASSASALGDVYVTSTGNVILAAAEDSYYDYKKETKKGFTSSSSKMQAKGGATSVGSSIGGEDITITAGENVAMAGSGIMAINDLSVKAEKGNILISSLEDTHFSRSVKKKSRTNFGGIKNLFLKGEAELFTKTTEEGKTKNVDNVGSVLLAGRDANFEANQNVAVIGSTLHAGRDLTVKAGDDVNLTPGRESAMASYVKRKDSFAISFKASLNEISLLAGHKGKEQGITRDGDYSAGSIAQAGRNLAIEAGRDVNQVGSHLRAGRM